MENHGNLLAIHLKLLSHLRLYFFAVLPNTDHEVQLSEFNSKYVFAVATYWELTVPFMVHLCSTRFMNIIDKSSLKLPYAFEKCMLISVSR